MKPGKIRIVRHEWSERDDLVVTCAPHVAIKLRRVFQGARRTVEAGSYTVSATPAHAYELEWFRKLYPLEIEPASLRKYRKLVREEKNKLEHLDKIGADDYVPRDFELALPPRDYQRFAADMALTTGQLLLADDIGVGKTVSAICMLAASGALPALVVTMTHLPIQWEREIGRFAPHLVVHRLRHGQPYVFGDKGEMVMGDDGKRRIQKFPAKPDVIIANYRKLDGWADTLAGKARAVIFDEAQELRHEGTNQYRAAVVVAGGADLRVGLTATPVYNYGPEILSILNVIAPGALGTRQEFFDEWCGGGGDLTGRDARKICVSNPAALGSYLRETGLMLRRTRRDVGRELPPLTVVHDTVETDSSRIHEAEISIAELAQRVLDRAGTSFERMQWSKDIDYRLRHATGIAKAPAVADRVRLLVECGERVLLYAWHHDVYNLIESALGRYMIKTARYTGAETLKEKLASVERFKSGDAHVLMMSLRAGAGLDGLQHVCRTVVTAELDWSPKVHEQNVGRVNRDGQPDPVMHYMLVADEGSDPVIADVLGIKEAQARGINDPYDKSVAHLVGSSDDHVRKLAENVLRRLAAKGHTIDAQSKDTAA